MNADAIAREILSIRRRLDEIEVERKQLPAESSGRRGELGSEEHELRARLMRLQDATIKHRDTQEIPGVPGITTRPAKPPP